MTGKRHHTQGENATVQPPVEKRKPMTDFFNGFACRKSHMAVELSMKDDRPSPHTATEEAT